MKQTYVPLLSVKAPRPGFTVILFESKHLDFSKQPSKDSGQEAEWGQRGEQAASKKQRQWYISKRLHQPLFSSLPVYSAA